MQLCVLNLSQQTEDIHAIAKHLALLPKKNTARPRVVIITQGTEPTVVAVSSSSFSISSTGHDEKNVTLKEFPIRPVDTSEINDTNGAG